MGFRLRTTGLRLHLSPCCIELSFQGAQHVQMRPLRLSGVGGAKGANDLPAPIVRLQIDTANVCTQSSSLIFVDKVPTPSSSRNPMNHNRFSDGIPKIPLA